MKAEPELLRRSTDISDTPGLSFNASIIALTQAAQVMPPIESDKRYDSGWREIECSSTTGLGERSATGRSNEGNNDLKDLERLSDLHASQVRRCRRLRFRDSMAPFSHDEPDTHAGVSPDSISTSKPAS
jgi:hypothetical protein